MKPAEQIEQSLKRLEPTALSQRASDKIGSMIDSLAASASEVEEADIESITHRRGWRGPVAWASIAAAVVLGAVLVWSLGPGDPGPVVKPVPVPVPGFEWVGRTDQVGELEDGGLMADENGRMHRLVRYQVIEEEVVRDGRSGAVMKVTGPREELMLVPVSTF
jgi:hypothetical protein